MNGRLSGLLVALIANGCGDDRAALDATVEVDAAVDVAPPDARPIGMLDAECQGLPGRPRVLVYTYENQWRHISNIYLRGAIYDMCSTRGFHVMTTNDPYSINKARLADVDVVVFAVTSGSGINRHGKQDFEEWVRAGGGVVGFEGASSTEQGWPFYVQNIGAAFYAHAPGLQHATVKISAGHPITDGLPSTLEITDQWYTFTSRPEQVPGLQVLMALDEDTLPADFPPAFKVGYHALGWAHEPLGGRVFYTAIGDNPEAFQNPVVLELTGRAIEWVAHQR